jgi:histone acetyltransferase (RNA polymerase elongator complex component)
MKLNEQGQCRVIGLTPETRPDQINSDIIKFLREIGATRVQLGVQHTDDKILKHINRGCYHKHTVRAIKMLKDNAFKSDIHLMPDLCPPPEYEGKMPIIDRAMLEQVNTDPDLKVDQIKIYPCVVTPWTKIKEWFDSGLYKPYGTNIPIDKEVYRRMNKDEKFEWRMRNPLYKNIFYFYTQIHPSIRVNRIFRDIPTNIICGGTTNSGIRSEIDRDMELMDLTNGCIRYREAGNYQNISRASKSIPVLKELEFESSGGTEYFLSWESNESKPILYSFLRLRLSPNSGKTHTGKIIFPELVDCALIRELHTYGKIKPCKENLKYYQEKGLLFGQAEIVQHKGFGKKLLERAEQIALFHGYKKIAVIAGVGVRDYYRTQGFVTDSEEGCYQIKSIGLVETNTETNTETNIETNNKTNTVTNTVTNNKTNNDDETNNETNIIFNHKNFLIFSFVFGFVINYIFIKNIFEFLRKIFLLFDY